MTISSLSVCTSERRHLYIWHQLFLSSSSPGFLLNESFLQCVFFRHLGQKTTPPDTPVSYTAQAAVHHYSSISYLLRYLHGLLCKHLILSGLTPVNIRQIVSREGDHSSDNGHPLTITSYRNCACPVIGCTSHRKSTMAVETNAIRGPLNSVHNSARPTVCIAPLSECFDEWPLPEGMNRKISGKVQCKTSPKQMTCKRVVKKYANMKKSPSTEFKRKLFLYSDSPRHPSPPSPSEPSPPSPSNPVDNGPNVTLKEKLLNGQTSENGSSEMRGNECDANGTNTAESVGTPNGKSLQAACNLVRRKYLKYWRKSLECTMAAGGERRFLKNVRLCDVFKPGSDKCLHARLPQNVIIPSHSPKRNTTSGHTNTHSENIPCSSPQQRTSRVSRWKTEDKNIFTLLNHTESVKIRCAKMSVRNEIKADKNTRIKTGSVAPSSNKHLNRQSSTNAKETSSDDPMLKRIQSNDNQKLTSSSCSSSRSHTNSLICIRKSSSRHCCVGISEPSLDCLKHGGDPCKSGLDKGPLEISCEKPSHQTCFSEDSAFSSGSSSSSSSSGSGIDSQEPVTKLLKMQRTRRKNGRQAPYSYNYFTNSEQEGPRIRRRRTCPCCMSSSPVKKRRRRSRSCGSDLPGDYQRFVQSTLRLNSLRNKLHLFLTVLFPKLDPFLDSISAESENIDLILNEAVSLVTSTEEPASEHSSSSSSSSSSSTAAKIKYKNNNNNSKNNNNTGSNNINKTNDSSSSSSCSMDNETIHSGPTLLNVKINVCRSPEQCLSRLTEKTLTLLSSLLPGLSFEEDYFHDLTSGHLEYLIDLVVHSNQPATSLVVDL